MSQDNRKRALGELVSVEAWHKEFSATRKITDLHVDVSFLTGRVGGEASGNVRFRLRLKRADVVVIVPETEPAAIDRASVARDTPSRKIKAEETLTTKTSRSGGLRGRVGAGARGMTAGVAADAGVSGSQSRDKAIRISQTLQNMLLTQFKTEDGHYAWRVEAPDGGTLDGKPWDSLKKPRLTVIDKRVDRTRGIEPAIRVEIRCKREDFDISDVVLTNDRGGLFRRDPNHRNKEIAAEAVIRTLLAEAGLGVGDLDNPFADIMLCAIMAESQ